MCITLFVVAQYLGHFAMYSVWKKVFVRLPAVSWFGVYEDFLPHAVLPWLRNLRCLYWAAL